MTCLPGTEESGKGESVDAGTQKGSSLGTCSAPHPFSHLVGWGGGHIIKYIKISIAKHRKIYTAWNRGNSPLSGQVLLPNKDESPLPPRPIRSIGKELRIVPGKERFYGKYFLSHSPGWVPSALCVPSTFPSPTGDHHSLC